jgi:hypothetical protein
MCMRIEKEAAGAILCAAKQTPTGKMERALPCCARGDISVGCRPFGPQNPKQYFTAARQAELTKLSSVLLFADTSDRVTISRKNWTKQGRVAVGTGVPVDLLERLGAFMSAHRLHYIYVDRNARTVTWASLAFRVRSCYAYSPQVSLSNLPPDVRSVTRLTDSWVFYISGGI